jgi:molybdopterin-containing oxidoreductase family iron-sulfur binding subunit
METDILIRMQEELQRALAKPAEKRRWAMLIDARKCVGCHACSVACASENKLPPKLWYRPVHEYERGKYPAVTRTFLARPCMQCDKPPCVAACPTKAPTRATWKETNGVGSGLVVIDYANCIGCGKCVPSCPYGARALDDGSNHTDGTPARQPYEVAASFEYGKKRSRTAGSDPVGKARKCHFCLHRLQGGQLPQCVSTCIGRATYFGDESDPESLVAKVKKANKVQLLKGAKGTAPRVYYVANEKLEAIYV